MDWAEVYQGTEIEAHLRAGFLESEGIECKVIPAKPPNVIVSPPGTIYPAAYNLTVFEAIIVPTDQAERARALLEESR